MQTEEALCKVLYNAPIHQVSSYV